MAAGRLFGAFLPGVDGDFAGLYFAAEAPLQDLLDQALPQACARAKVELCCGALIPAPDSPASG